MKRLMVFLACFSFILSSVFVYAAPVGNIAAPVVLKKGIFMQDQKQDYAIILTSENGVTFDRNLEKQEVSSQFLFYGGKAGVLYMDKYIVYGIAGAGQALQQFKVSGTNITWDTEYGLVWGAGGTAVIYETTVKELMNGILRVGIDGRYMSADLDVDEVRSDSNNFGLVGTKVTSSGYDFGEWQIALAAALQIDKFIPYAGLKYSDAIGEVKATVSSVPAAATTSSTDFKVDFENKDNVGIFVGADYLLGDSCSINAEGRFIDETAFSVGANLRF